MPSSPRSTSLSAIFWRSSPVTRMGRPPFDSSWFLSFGPSDRISEFPHEALGRRERERALKSTDQKQDRSIDCHDVATFCTCSRVDLPRELLLRLVDRVGEVRQKAVGLTYRENAMGSANEQEDLSVDCRCVWP